MKIKRLAVSWQLSDLHGWGIFGLNLVQTLVRHGPVTPMILTEPTLLEASEEELQELRPLISEMRKVIATIKAQGQSAHSAQIAVLHALGPDFKQGEASNMLRFKQGEASNMLSGEPNIGFTFFEKGKFAADAIERANAYDRILAGSTWNRDYGRASGIRDIEFVSQGVDTSLFHPSSPSNAYSNHFTIFSGGKLELRKGQDLVVAAFRIFHDRHPDSLLITSWQNHWPESTLDLATSMHVSAAPEVDKDGKLLIADWAVANGAPPESFIDLGWLPNRKMPSILRDMDVAVFPNRCEGGTNLVAMEAMACGVPCILSGNTGHLDIIAENNCFVLEDQRPMIGSNGQTEMWRESQIEEILENLEIIYSDRSKAKMRGTTGATFMRTRSWVHQTADLVTKIEDLF